MAYLGSGMEEVEKTVATVNMVCDTMTGNGSLATMTIGASQEMPGHVNNVSIYFDGVAQRPTTDYTLSGKTITFSTVPETGVNVVCLSYASEFLDVISDATVYGAEILDGALTDAKIATGVSASKLTGALPAINGSAVTNFAPRAVTKNASDPTSSTNPANGQGTVWANTTSGEMFICTDATSNENIWINVGGGSGDVQPWTFQGSIEAYISGGIVVGGAKHNNIQKFSFSSNTTGTDLGDLTRTNYLSDGTSSNTHGYSPGGLSVSTIDKFQFSTSNNATSHGSLTAVRHSSSSSNSETEAFVFGGQSYLSTIEKYAFSSNTTAAAHGNLSAAKNDPMGSSSTTHGYSAGGHTPTVLTTIDKFAFSSNTTAASHGDLITLRSHGAGTSSLTDGYASGGANAGGDTAVIEKYSFASNVTATSHGNLSQARDGAANSSHTTHGYSSGGQRNSGPGNASITLIDKFAYASNTTAASHGSLAQGSYAAAGHQF